MKTINFLAYYRMGHSIIKSETTISAKAIAFVQRIPEEQPEYLDGALTRLCLYTGESLWAMNKYEDIIEQYNKALEVEEE